MYIRNYLIRTIGKTKARLDTLNIKSLGTLSRNANLNRKKNRCSYPFLLPPSLPFSFCALPPRCAPPGAPKILGGAWGLPPKRGGLALGARVCLFTTRNHRQPFASTDICAPMGDLRVLLLPVTTFLPAPQPAPQPAMEPAP